MSNLNYGIGKTFALLLEQLKSNLFISVILSCVLLGIVLYLNKNNKIMKYIFILINLILLSFIILLYIKNILKFNYTNSFKNIYVYTLNVIIYLIVSVILNRKIYQYKTNLICYILNLIGIIYSVIMTLYLKNTTIIVIGNIFPQIFFGNIFIIITYIYFLKNKFLTKKK